MKRAEFEPLVFVALVLVYIWFVQPTDNDWIRVPFLALLVALPFASNVWHGDSLRRLGVRADNLAVSIREVGLATLAGAALILAIGWWAGGIGFERWMLRSLLLYPAWGLAQQYAMQAFTYNRFRGAGRGPAAAALAAALLFGVAHLPNLALASLTAVGGYVWCRLFERHRNLFTLAVSHGWLAVLIRAAWPAEWLHNLRIGPTFWTWAP